MKEDKTRKKNFQQVSEGAAREKLEISAARLSTVITNLQEGVLVEDENRNILLINRRFIDMFGIPATVDQLIGTDCSNAAEDSKHLFQEPEEFVRRIDIILKQQKLVTGEDIPLADGRTFQRDYVPIFLEERYLGHMWAYRDISEQIYYREKLEKQAELLKKMNVELESLASRDALTGVSNRRAFLSRLKEEIRRSGRTGGPLSLLMMDVDRFKAYNDTFGHPEGDRALVSVAAVLERTSRETDFCARYGGEEFAVVLGETDSAESRKAAERIRSAVEASSWDKRQVTVSIGAATLSAVADELKTDTIINLLISQADEALYQSKAAGRNRCTHHEDLHTP